MGLEEAVKIVAGGMRSYWGFQIPRDAVSFLREEYSREDVAGLVEEIGHDANEAVAYHLVLGASEDAIDQALVHS